MNEKIIDKIKFTIINSIQPSIEYDENDKPFAYIEDKYKDNASEEVINFVVKVLVDFTLKLSDNNYNERLAEVLKEKNIDLLKNDIENVELKVKESLNYYFDNI
jgi:hypothetical protein